VLKGKGRDLKTRRREDDFFFSKPESRFWEKPKKGRQSLSRKKFIRGEEEGREPRTQEIWRKEKETRGFRIPCTQG